MNILRITVCFFFTWLSLQVGAQTRLYQIEAADTLNTGDSRATYEKYFVMTKLDTIGIDDYRLYYEDTLLYVIYGYDSTVVLKVQDTLWITYPEPSAGGGDTSYYWIFTVDGGTHDTITQAEIINLVAGSGVNITGGTNNPTINAPPQDIDTFSFNDVTNVLTISLDSIDGVHTVIIPDSVGSGGTIDTLKYAPTRFLFSNQDSLPSVHEDWLDGVISLYDGTELRGLVDDRENIIFGEDNFNVFTRSASFRNIGLGLNNFESKTGTIADNIGIGYSNAQAATGTVDKNVLIGDRQLVLSSNITETIAIGTLNLGTGTLGFETVSNSVFIGSDIANNASASTINRFIGIGHEVANAASQFTDVIALGYQAGYNNSYSNVFIAGDVDATQNNQIRFADTYDQARFNNYRFNIDQTLASKNNYVLTYIDDSDDEIELTDIYTVIDTTGWGTDSIIPDSYIDSVRYENDTLYEYRVLDGVIVDSIKAEIVVSDSFNIQTIDTFEIRDDSIFISLSDYDSTHFAIVNDSVLAQTLSIDADTITLSDGGGSVVITHPSQIPDSLFLNIYDDTPADHYDSAVYRNESIKVLDHTQSAFVGLNTTGTNIIIPKDNVSNPVGTGALRIELPQTGMSCDIKLIVDVISITDSSSFEVHLSGRLTSGTWSGTTSNFFIQREDQSRTYARYGTSSGGKTSVWIGNGESTTLWTNETVTLKEVHVSGTDKALENWVEGWAFWVDNSFISDVFHAEDSLTLPIAQPITFDSIAIVDDSLHLSLQRDSILYKLPIKDHDWYHMLSDSTPYHIDSSIWTRGFVTIGDSTHRNPFAVYTNNNDAVGIYNAGDGGETHIAYYDEYGNHAWNIGMSPGSGPDDEPHFQIYKKGASVANIVINNTIGTKEVLTIDSTFIRAHYYGDGNATGTPTYIAGWDSDGVFMEVDPDSVTITGAQDADWYEVGGTTSPDTITDHSWTKGRVAIGKDTSTNTATLFIDQDDQSLIYGLQTSATSIPAIALSETFTGDTWAMKTSASKYIVQQSGYDIPFQIEEDYDDGSVGVSDTFALYIQNTGQLELGKYQTNFETNSATHVLSLIGNDVYKTNIDSLGGGGSDSLGTAFTQGQIIYGDGTRAGSSESNLFWDETNNRLGIGTSLPTGRFHIEDPNALSRFNYNQTGGTNMGIQYSISGVATWGSFIYDNDGDGYADWNWWNNPLAGPAMALEGQTSQLQLNAYTTTTSFSGTEVGLLGYDNTGRVLTTPFSDVLDNLSINTSSPVIGDGTAGSPITLGTDVVNGTHVTNLQAIDLAVNVVSSIDGVTNDGGNIDLVAGTGITITPSDGSNNITIAAPSATDDQNLSIGTRTNIAYPINIEDGTGVSLGLFSSSFAGLVPAGSGVSGQYLNQNGTWSTPSVSGDGDGIYDGSGNIGTSATASVQTAFTISAGSGETFNVDYTSTSGTELIIGSTPQLISGNGVLIGGNTEKAEFEEGTGLVRLGHTTPNSSTGSAIEFESGGGINLKARYGTGISDVYVEADDNVFIIADDILTLRANQANTDYIHLDLNSSDLYVFEAGSEAYIGNSSTVSGAEYILFSTAGTVGINVNGSNEGSFNQYGLGVNGAVPDATYALHLTGNFGQSGTTAYKAGTLVWTTYSDRRIKRDIDYIDGLEALEIVKSFDPASFRYKKEYASENGIEPDELFHSYIAQDIEEVLPGAVKEVEGVKVIDGGQILAYESAALRELIKENERLKKDIRYLQERDKQLIQRIEKLERK